MRLLIAFLCSTGACAVVYAIAPTSSVLGFVALAGALLSAAGAIRVMES